MRRRKNYKIANAFTGISATGSIISAHNVCHTLCLSVVVIMSVFGIAVASDSLMFLQEYNLLFWSMGLIFLSISLFLLTRFPKCMSRKAIVANIGLLIIGFPFSPARIQFLFWIFGGLTVSSAIFMYFRDRYGIQKGGRFL